MLAFLKEIEDRGILTRLAAAQIALTGLILLVLVFLLGFVADPIINLYVDPWSFLSPWSSSDYYYEDEERASWVEHFIKGFTSLGVVGFLKVIIASPFAYFRFGGSSRGRATGRDRMEQVSWLIILIGVATTLAVSNIKPFQLYKILPASSISTANVNRQYTKVSGRGVVARLKKLASASWMFKATTMMRTTKQPDSASSQYIWSPASLTCHYLPDCYT